MTSPDRNHARRPGEYPVPIDRKGLPAQPVWVLAILSALSAAALAWGVAWVAGSIRIPGAAAQAAAGAMLLLLLVYSFRVLRTMRWTPILMILAGAILTYLSGSAVLPAMLIALVCSAAFSAFLLAVSDKPTLTRLPFIPLAAYGLALAVCRDPILSLTALIPFPPAAALAFGTRAAAAREDGPGRVGVICLGSLGFGAAVLGVAALLLNRSLGSLSPAHLGAWLDSLRTELSLRLTELTQQLAEQIPQLTALTEEQSLNIINSFINLAPGTAVAVCNLCSFLMLNYLHGCLFSFGYASSLREKVTRLRMSLVSAVVYLIAGIIWIVTTLSGSESTLVGTVAQNIVIILSLGLAAAGVVRIMSGPWRRAGGCLQIILVLLLPCLMIYASSLLAAYEAIASILGAIFARVRPPHDGDAGDSYDNDSYGGNGGSNDNGNGYGGDGYSSDEDHFGDIYGYDEGDYDESDEDDEDFEGDEDDGDDPDSGDDGDSPDDPAPGR